jgi:membrane protease subunit HflC
MNEQEPMFPAAAARQKKKKKKIWAAIKGTLGLAAIITAFSSYYTVDQSEQAVVTQLGRPTTVVLNSVTKDTERTEELTKSYQDEGVAVSEGAGFRLKVPFIQSIRTYDRRLLRWNGFPEEIPTRDKKYIWIDTTARWYIEDPLQFLRSVGTEEQAHTRLDDIIDSATRNAITQRNLIEVVRTNNREMEVTEEELKETTQVEQVYEGRPKIVAEITRKSKEACKEYGIGIHEMGILVKGLTYVDQVKKEVENRMIAERLRIAEKYKSEGEGEYQKIKGEKEKEVMKILSEAYKLAREIEGAADGQATEIYAKGFSKDPHFYEYMRKLQLYVDVLGGEKTKLVLGTDNPLLEAIKGKNIHFENE